MSQLKFEMAEGPIAESYYAHCNKIMFPERFAKIGETKCIIPVNYMKHSESILNFPIRKDDVWVVGFSKSGTTWTQEMVWLIGNDLNYESAAKIDIRDRFPHLETSAVFGQPPHLTNSDSTMTQCEKAKSPRFIKSHLPTDLLPEDLWKVKPKMIYVERNVKDVCISYFRHYSSFQNYKGSLEEWAEAFLTDNALYCPYWPYIKSYWKLKGDSNILFLCYEEMKFDIKGAIQKTAAFLNKRLTEQQIQTLADHLSFNKMKQNPAVNRDGISKYGVQASGFFIRKGQVGSWKEELSPELIQRFDEWIEANKLVGAGFPIH